MNWADKVDKEFPLGTAQQLEDVSDGELEDQDDGVLEDVWKGDMEVSLECENVSEDKEVSLESSRIT